MANFNEDFEGRGMGRQRDFVLNMNEFAHILNKTDGSIKCAVGPFQTSLSQQEVPVIFNVKTKRFVECTDYDQAKQLFISAPEGWYVTLKNPTADMLYPLSGRTNTSPTNIQIGKKVNITGPVSFALFPGQMAKVIQGHRLRHNQYLVARVYDADAANEGKEKNEKKDYFTGQLFIIKGTEVSFYIPPTGVEIIPNSEQEYVRDAVTLERLEYCILKNENGNKRYMYGPAVVFPEPTETFVKTPHGGNCFRAIELSKISGIYVKVIAEYTDENNITHPVGEELFITGNDQMIYYPRPEHAIINYDGKFMHHAIAIPEGEGRYIMNRETGVITTVVGPKMYLPDPRTEVVVKRKLTPRECILWYPNNTEVFNYNCSLSEQAVEKTAKSMVETCMFSATNDITMDMLESKASISRGTSYTKPRTIMLDNKYDGVVSINIWTGYAVNVVSKSGKREIVVGPATKLLDYDETLEVLTLSTGKPKTTDDTISTVYLRVENNKISDIINAQTKDYVNVEIKVSYCVNFLEEYKDKWFSVENYIKYLCDRERSLIKKEVKKYGIEEFYANSSDIIRKIALNKNDNSEKNNNSSNPKGRLFKENGMLVTDVEVLSVSMSKDIAEMMKQHQQDSVERCLKLSEAENKFNAISKLKEYERKEAELVQKLEMYKLELEHTKDIEKIKNSLALEEAEREKEKAIQLAQNELQKEKLNAENALQEITSSIYNQKLERDKKAIDVRINEETRKAEIEKNKQEAYAATIKNIFESISPDLISALESNANASMLENVTSSMSPYAISQGESVADVTNRLLRGTSLENIINDLSKVNK